VDEELFNIELRKFLKKFGITAQREIEKAVHSAIESGRLAGHETLKVSAVLRVERALEELVVDGEIELG
jgi:uncharacterized protein DUF6494